MVSTASTSSTLGWVKALPQFTQFRVRHFRALHRSTASLVLPCLDHADGAAKPFWRTNLGFCSRRSGRNRSCSRADLSRTPFAKLAVVREPMGSACSSFRVCVHAPLVDDLDFRFYGDRRNCGL